MSRQLTLSSILAVLAMASTAVLASVGERSETNDGANSAPIAQLVEETLYNS